MKKTLLAAAIPALLFANGAAAVELYNDGANQVAMGGHLGVSLQGASKGDTKIGENSPRINFAFNRDLGNGFKLDSKVEWGMNLIDDGDVFYNRLGYLGLAHDDYGHVRVGKQWSVYSDAALFADMPIAFANDYLYDNHGDQGTGRANKAVSYRKGHDFGNAGTLNIGLQWQGAEGDFDDRYAASAIYGIAGFAVSYGYIGGDLEVDGATEEGMSQTVGVKYGKYGKGLYFGANYNTADYTLRNAGDLMEESIAYDAIVAYALDNGLNLSVNYEKVEDDKNSIDVREETAIQAEYFVNPGLVVFTGYQFDLNDDSDNDKWQIGARIYL